MGIIAISREIRFAVSNALSAIGDEILDIEKEIAAQGYCAFTAVKNRYEQAISAEIEPYGYIFQDYYRERAKEKIASLSLYPIPLRENGYVSDYMDRGRDLESARGKPLGFGSTKMPPYRLKESELRKALDEAKARKAEEGEVFDGLTESYKFSSIADRRKVLIETIRSLDGEGAKKVSAMTPLLSRHLGRDWYLVMFLPTNNLGTSFSNAVLDFRLCIVRAEGSPMQLRIESMADVFQVRLEEAVLGFGVYRTASTLNELAVSAGAYAVLMNGLYVRVQGKLDLL